MAEQARSELETVGVKKQEPIKFCEPTVYSLGWFGRPRDWENWPPWCSRQGGGGNKDTTCMSSICGSRLVAGEKNVWWTIVSSLLCITNEHGTHHFTKRAKSTIHGCYWCSDCTFCSCSELKGICSLPTTGLCQLWSSPKPQASNQSTMPLQVQSHRTSLALGISRYFGEARAHQHP